MTTETMIPCPCGNSLPRGAKKFCSRLCNNRANAKAQTARMIATFWDRLDKTAVNGCWEWTGARNHRGYGWVGGTSTHRMAYALAVGPVPEGLFVCHHCDNPPCCNPAHLFLGTVYDNNADMVAKGRNARGEQKIRTHKLTEIEVREILADSRRGSELADEYGVSRSLITMIRQGRVWGHLSA